MIKSFFNNSNPKQLKKKYYVISLLISMALFITWGISTPRLIGIGDGAFPAGEFHLMIKNEKGEIIKGAKLSVIDSKTQEPAYTYPFDNYIPSEDLISNEQGAIIVQHKFQGMEFGGVCMEYFGFYKKCSSSVREFRGQIQADGYKLMSFSANDLLFNSINEKAIKGSTYLIYDNGYKERAPVYELTLTLEED